MSGTLPYFVGCLIYPSVFSKVPAKIQFVISFFFAAIAIGVAGTTPAFGLPDDELWIVIFGLILLGLTIPFIFVTTIPETIDAIRVEFKIIQGLDPLLDSKVQDISSLLTNMATGFAGLFGPVLGGVLYDMIGYKATMTVIMCFEFLVALVFLVLNRPSYEKERKQKRLIKLLDHLGEGG